MSLGRLKPVTPDGSTYNKVKYCLAENCKNYTSNGKDYCLDHILMTDYMKKLAKDLKRIDYERRHISKLNKNSILIRDVAAMLLGSKELSSSEVSRHLRIDINEAEKLLLRAVKLGVCKVKRRSARRNLLYVKPVNLP